MHSASTTIQQWEEAGTSLENALLRYLDLSALIGSQNLETEKSSDDLLVRIDSSLQHLHTTLDQQLDQLRAILAKSRNKIGCRINNMPEEILYRIFTHVVYETDEPIPYAIRLGMSARVRNIYRRLHNLLAVCTTWRNFGLSRGKFWTIIPIFDTEQNQSTPPSTELSLQRSTACDLRLAVSLSQAVEPQDRLEVLKTHIPRLRFINISSDVPSVIHTTIRMLLDHGAAESISKLSLHCTVQPRNIFKAPQTEDYLNHGEYPFRNRCDRLMKSLSALRIRNTPLNWDRVAFSARMVEFRIDHIIFGSHTEARIFFRALSSASQLQELKIVTVSCMLGEGETAALSLPGVRASLPNLHSLYLERLTFTDLSILLTAIVPGPYNATTLNMTRQLKLKLSRNHSWGQVGIEEICELLSQFPINKLILRGCKTKYFWSSPAVLNRLLRSMPSLKALTLHSYLFNHDTLQALKQPQCSPPDDQSDFPRLENLEFRNARISGDGSELRDLVTGVHPIRRLVLGGFLQYQYGLAPARRIQSSDAIVAWLRASVSSFCLVHDYLSTIETEGNVWPLWDV